jgi:hypothetical protein
MVERFSTTPLAIKLGVKEDSTLALLHAPPTVTIELPTGVRARRRAQGRVDVVVAFYTRSARLERQIDAMSTLIFPSGGLWIAWPKKSSGVLTDLTDHAVREIALPLGLVDNKVCAIDETWTAMRVVWRLTRRTTTDAGSTALRD